MKETPLRKMSDKMRKQKLQEAKLRQELLEECKGHCMKCGKLPDWRGLGLHEEILRSHGGKPSRENSILVCGRCHSLAEGIVEVPI